MAIVPFENSYPDIHPTTYVDDMAKVIGKVSIGAEGSIWPMAVIRGDVNYIKIGDKTNIQDGCVLHVSHDGPYHPGGSPLVIGDRVTVGHQAMLHACTVMNDSLIGIGAIVLDHAVIESQVMLGAGSLVPPHKRLESGYLWLGSPVKKIRPLTAEEIAFLTYSAEHYILLKNRHVSNKV